MNHSLLVIIFVFFSGIVQPFASISITDDIPTVSNLDAIKSKEEQTSLFDDALPTATQVDIEQISKQLTLSLSENENVKWLHYAFLSYRFCFSS